MDLKIYTSGPFDTNCYLYFDPVSKNGVLIDAPPGSYSLIEKDLEDINLTHLLLTHSHWDHTADAHKIKNAIPNINIGIHEQDKQNLVAPGSDGLPMFYLIEPEKPDTLLKEGDEVFGLKVIETPGHTPGGICFYDEKNNVLFSGDTLFKNTIGNLSFPTARPELMWKSLSKLAKLPADVKVFPGHGESTFIGNETWLGRAEEIFG